MGFYFDLKIMQYSAGTYLQKITFTIDKYINLVGKRYCRKLDSLELQ